MSEKNEWKLAEALRESLLWTASSLAAVGKEQDVIVLEGRKRTIGEILDEANAALDAPSAPGDAQDGDRMTVLYVAGAICRHLDMALDQSKVMAAARDIAQHIAAPAAGDAQGDAKDAARWRWARAHWGRIVDTYEGNSGVVVSIEIDECRDSGWHTDPDTLDAALDAAIAAQQGEGGAA